MLLQIFLIVAVALVFSIFYWIFVFDQDEFEKRLLPYQLKFTPKRQHNISKPANVSSQANVLLLEQVDKSFVNLVGGKGANLGELIKAGFPVPRGFCITSNAYKIYKRLGNDGFCFKELCEAYRSLVGSPPAMVAIRSSATSEDSKASSFAGQLDTFLGIKDEKSFVDHVLRCWESINSDRIKSYSQHYPEIDLSAVDVCIVVQLMVDATAAGVMFTQNPVNVSSNQVAITANYGLGESVVSDLVTPDTFLVDGTTKNIISKKLGSKEKKIILSKISSKCTEEFAVSVKDQGEFCISDGVITSLSALGRRIEEHYGAPQDIEWAVEGNKLFLLQARPITTLNQSRSGLNEFDDTAETTDWITTCNAQEMFPGAGTPLSISLLKPGMNFGLQLLQLRFGVRREISSSVSVTSWHYGKMFLNMTEFLSALVSGMVGGSLAKENGEMSILGRLNEKCTLADLEKKKHLPPQPIFIKLLNGVFYSSVLVRALLGVYESRMKARFEKCKKILDSKLFQEVQVSEKYSILRNLMKDYILQWADGVTCGSSSAGTMLAVMKILAKDSSEMWSNDLIAKVALLIKSQGDDKAISSEPVRLVSAVVQALQKELDPDTLKKFVELPNDAFHNELMVSEKESGATYRRIIMEHGHRCVKESEFRTEEWAVHPAPLISLIKSSLSSAKKPVHMSKDNSASEEALDLVTLKLGLIKDFLLFYSIKLANLGVRMRESGKSLQIKYNNEFKVAVRKIAKDLVALRRLKELDLIYFITFDELGELCYITGNEHHLIDELNLKAIKRRSLWSTQDSLTFVDLCLGAPKPTEEEEDNVEVPSSGEIISHGTPASTGIVRGPARVVRTLQEAEALQPGEILVCPITDVGWTPYFGLAIGIITETGGFLSHGAVVAREYGIPCVVNVRKCCATFKTGDMLLLNGNAGVVKKVKHEEKLTQD